jgi:hypothetical protein
VSRFLRIAVIAIGAFALLALAVIGALQDHIYRVGLNLNLKAIVIAATAVGLVIAVTGIFIAVRGALRRRSGN